MFRRIVNIILYVVAAALAGCSTDRLVYPGEEAVVNVVFDWSLAPQAEPAGMTLLFYPVGDGEIYRFDISGRNGGPVKLPQGTYDIIAYNSDSYSEMFGYTAYFHLMYAYTRSYSASWFSSATSARAVPKMMWTASAEEIEVTGACSCRSGNTQTVTLQPMALNAEYTVIAENIGNLDNVRTAGATLGGMAWAVTLSDRRLYPDATSLPFLMSRDGVSEVKAEITPFGDNPSPGNSNKLTLFFTLKDASMYSYEFDVTKQVNEAPDPRKVTIRVGGITLPDVNPGDTIGNSGLDVRVDGWQTVRIDM